MVCLKPSTEQRKDQFGRRLRATLHQPATGRASPRRNVPRFLVLLVLFSVFPVYSFLFLSPFCLVPRFLATFGATHSALCIGEATPGTLGSFETPKEDFAFQTVTLAYRRRQIWGRRTGETDVDVRMTKRKRIVFETRPTLAFSLVRRRRECLPCRFLSLFIRVSFRFALFSDAFIPCY